MFFQTFNSASEYSGCKNFNVAQLNTLSTIVPQPSLLCLAPVKNPTTYQSNNKIKLNNCKHTIPNVKKYQPVLNNIKIGTSLPSNYENHIKFDKNVQNPLYIVKSQNTLLTNNKMGVKLFLPNHKNERSLLTQPVINKAFNISNMPMTQKTANIMSYLKPVILTKPLTKIDQSNHPIYVTYIPNSLSNNNSSPIILLYISRAQPIGAKNSITTSQNINPKCSVVPSNKNKIAPNKGSTLSKANLLKNSLLFADYDSLDDTDEEVIKNQRDETWLIKSTSIKHDKKICGKKDSHKNQSEKHSLYLKHMNIMNLLGTLTHEPHKISKFSTMDISSKVGLDLLCKNYNNECQKKPCIFTSFLNQSSGENILQNCSRYALPYSNLCSIHIAAHPHQKLFERCSAKFSNNFQCIKPAFDPINDVPLCWQHSRKKAHHDLTLEKNQKSSSHASLGTSKRPAKMSQTLLVLEKGETVLRDLHALISPTHQGPADKSNSSNASNSNINAPSILGNNQIANIDGNHNQQQRNKKQVIRNNSGNSCAGNNITPLPPNDKTDPNASKPHANSVRAGKANKRERKRRPATSKKSSAPVLLAPNSSKRGKMTSGYAHPHFDNPFTNAILANHTAFSNNIAEVDNIYSRGKKTSTHTNILGSQVGMAAPHNRFKPPPSMFGPNDPFLSGSNACSNQQYPRRNGCYNNGPFNGNGMTITNNNGIHKRPSLTMSPLSNVTGENSHNSNDLLFNFSTDLLDKSFDTDTLNAATNMIIEDVDMKDLNKLSEESFNDIFKDMGKEGNLSLNHMEDSSSSLPTKEDEILMNQALSDITKDITAAGPVAVDFESEIIRLIQANLMKDYQPQSSFPISTPAPAPLLTTTSSSHNVIQTNNNYLFSANVLSPPQTFLLSNTTTINPSSSQQPFNNHFPISTDFNQQHYLNNHQRQLTSRSASLPSVVYDSLPSHPLSPLDLISPTFLVNGLNVSPINGGMMIKGDKNINSLPSVAHLLGPKTAPSLPLSFTPHTA